MRKRNLYTVSDKVTIKRFVAAGGGVHIRYEGETCGYVERWRMLDRAGRMMTVWIPVQIIHIDHRDGAYTKDRHLAPKADLREAVERVVRAHEIHVNGYTVFTAVKGS